MFSGTHLRAWSEERCTVPSSRAGAQEMWDSDGAKGVPPTEALAFEELSEEQQAAAIKIG